MPTYSTPDNQRERYEQRGAVNDKTTGDYVDDAYDDGFAAGRSAAERNTPAPSSSGSSTAGGSRGSGRLAVGAPLALELVFISADELVTKHRFPLPSRLLAALVVFGALGMARGEAERPASAIAWALVIATFYSGTAKTVPPALTAIDAIGSFFGGTAPATAGTAGAQGAQGPQGPTAPTSGVSGGGGARRDR